MKRLIAFIVVSTALTLTGCASYSGAGLKPGMATVSDVQASMGEPGLTWKYAHGQINQMAYVRGPAGWVSFMVYFDDAGKLTHIDQVLDERHFTLVPIGATQDEVLKILGPYRDTYEFPAKNELDWNYGYCSSSLLRMTFSVTFDDRTLLVKGNGNNPDPYYQRGGMYTTYCIPWTGSGSFENP